MIAMNLQEKLCNELFQYASAKGIARKLNLPFTLIGSSFAGNRLLNLKCLYGDIRNFRQTEHFLESNRSEKIYPEVFQMPDGTLFDGYFQSDFYFEHISNEIKQDFKLERTTKAEEVLNQYPIDQYCYIHVRGKDYTTVAKAWLLPKIYWENAMLEIKKLNPDIKFIVFTDDVNYASELFKEENIICMRNDELTDMYCLSHSKYFIMANSSFSWWCMYLNECAEFIIGPDKWFNHNNIRNDMSFVPEGIKYKKVNLWL